MTDPAPYAADQVYVPDKPRCEIGELSVYPPKSNNMSEGDVRRIQHIINRHCKRVR